MSATARHVYKIAAAAAWRDAEAIGEYRGSPDDLRDGFIHFSTAEQAPATAAKFFAGALDLVIAAIDVAALGAELKWEPSRGGALFPHLYAPLPMSAVHWVKALPLDLAGHHRFPEDMT